MRKIYALVLGGMMGRSLSAASAQVDRVNCPLPQCILQLVESEHRT